MPVRCILPRVSTIIPFNSAPQPRRVLVVEDNLDSVHSMAMLVKAMGHECEFAINGFAALEIARRFRPDIIFLDLVLPDFNGHQIAQQLKWEPGLERTRIIALSGLPINDMRERVLQSGCEAIYAKPLDPAVLERLLEMPSSDVTGTTDEQGQSSR